MINYSEKRQEYIKELEALPYGEGVLVLPNAGLQREVKLHHMVKCIGLDTLAVEVINAAGLNKYDVISRKAQELIVEKILDEHAGELKYFGKLLGKPGLVTSLVNLFTEFRSCGVADADTLAQIFADWRQNKEGPDADVGLVRAPVDKNDDVLLLFKAYLEQLGTDLIDLEGQYLLAIEHIDALDKLPYKKIYVSDMPMLSQLECDFIAALGNKAVFVKADDFVFKNELCACVDAHENVKFLKYGSHRDELAGTFREVRQLLGQGIASEKIGVVVSNYANFSGISHMAEIYGVPITLANSVKLSAQPLFLNIMSQVQGYGTVADFAKQIKSFKDLELQKQKDWYASRKISLKELQTDLKAKDALLSLLDEVARDYECSGLQNKKLGANDYVVVLRDLADKKNIKLSQATESGVTVCEPIDALGKEFDQLFVLGLNDGEYPKPVRENWIYTDRERELLGNVVMVLPLTDKRYHDNERIFLMLLMACKKNLVLSWAETDKPAQCTYCDELLLLYVQKLVNKFEQTGQQFVYQEKDKTEGKTVEECEVLWKEKGSWERLQYLSELFETLKLANTYVVQDQRNIFIPRITLPDEDTQSIIERSSVDFRRKSGDIAYLGYIGKLKRMSSSVTYRVTELEKFARCPFSYLASVVWGINDYEEDEDALPATEAGNLAHKTLEIFIKRYVEKYSVSEKFGNQDKKILLYSEIDAGKYDDSDEHKQAVKTALKELLADSYTEAKQIIIDDLIKKQRFTPLREQQMAVTENVLAGWFEADFEQQWQKKLYRPFGVEVDFDGVRLNELVEESKEGDEHICLKGKFDRVDVGIKTEGDGENIKQIPTYRVVDYKSSSGAVPNKKYDMQIGIYQLVAPQLTGFNLENNTLKIERVGAYQALKGGRDDDTQQVMYGVLNNRNFDKNDIVGKIRVCSKNIEAGNFDIRNEVTKDYFRKRKGNIQCPDYCAFKTICRLSKSEAAKDED